MPLFFDAPTSSLYKFRSRNSSPGAAAPLLTLDFTASIPGGVTVTASPTTGFVKNVAGTLATFASNAGRRTDLGLCIEAARINTHLQSSVLATSHSLITATRTANTATAPDGTATADTLIPNNAAVSAGINSTPFVSHTAGTYTFSTYVKNQGINTVLLEVNDGTNGAGTADLNLTTGVFADIPYAYGSGFTAVSQGVEALANGWYRLYLTYTVSGTVSLGQFVLTNDVGNGTNAFAIWGQQDELGATPSTHINTTTGSVTRAADNVGFTIPGGATSLRYTFDDNSTQDVSVTPGAYAIPTTLNRPLIKTIVGT